MGTDLTRAADEQGYRHEPVLDGLVPRLVGLQRQRERRVRPEYRTARPIVHVIGGRASGKTLLLKALYAGYTDRVPLARVDLASPHLGEPGLADVTRLDAPDATAVTQLLYVLSYQLGLDAQWVVRRLRFPRLSVGLLVVTAYRPDPPDSDGAADGGGRGDGAGVAPQRLRTAEEELRLALRAAGDQDRRRLRRTVWTWLAALEGVIGVLLPEHKAVEVVFEIARKELLAPRVSSSALQWWGGQFRQRQMFQGDALERLFAFARYFREGGDSRREAEELLVRALLADIAGHHGPLSRLNRLPPPLLLLDSLHEPLGVEFLGLLREGYAAERDQVRPVVVGTSLGRATGPGLRAFPDVDDATHWQPPARGSGPEAWELRLGIPAMDAMQIGRMLTSAGN